MSKSIVAVRATSSYKLKAKNEIAGLECSHGQNHRHNNNEFYYYYVYGQTSINQSWGNTVVVRWIF